VSEQATIWNGNEFCIVPQDEADELVKQDKAQDVSKRLHGATELKYRRDFTGYRTREVRAAPPSEPKMPAPTANTTADNWQEFRSDAARKLGKAYNKTTKAETIAYMEQNLGMET